PHSPASSPSPPQPALSPAPTAPILPKSAHSPSSSHRFYRSFSPPPSHGVSLPMSLGNRHPSRTLSSPSSCTVSRSRPIPRPPWGGMPHRNASRYSSMPSSVMPLAAILS